MRKNAYPSALLAVITLCLFNSIIAQNQARYPTLNTTQSVQKKKIDNIIKCRVSFEISSPTSVASLYFNFDHSALEVINIELLSNDLSIAEELSNRSALETVNKTGFIDIVLYKSSYLSFFSQDQSIDMLEITFKSKTLKTDLLSAINLNTEFPRKTSLAYNGEETNENNLEKNLEIVSTDGRLIEKKTFQSFSSSRPNKANMATFNIQLNVIREDEQLALIPSEILADANLTLSSIKSQPNPFTHSTTILYQLKQESNVQIELFNQYGFLIKRISSGRRDPGSHQVILSGQELPAGVYFCRLLADTNPLKTLKLIKL